MLKDSDLRDIKSGKVVPGTKKISDGDGLYVEIKLLKSGVGLYWRYDYTFAGRRKTLSIGVYPLIGVKKARDRLRSAKVELSAGNDPSVVKRASKISASDANNFKTVAYAWLEVKPGGKKHKESILRYFEKDIFPVLGKFSVDEITPPDVVKLINRVGDRGSLDQAKRVGRWVYKIFKYAMTVGKATNNPADIDFSMIIPVHVPKTHAAIIDPVIVGQLLRSIDCYSGAFITRCLLNLAALLMVRPGNLVSMEWSEVDRDAKTWTIPARKLKAKQHIKVLNRQEDSLVVPLSVQACDVLDLLDDMRRKSPYVFPNQRGKATHMCVDTIRAALRIMGYPKDVMSGHGFRAMARTMLEERLGWSDKLAEIQLGHKVKSHGGAYDRTQYLEKRIEMMQAWADYLDTLRVTY